MNPRYHVIQWAKRYDQSDVRLNAPVTYPVLLFCLLSIVQCIVIPGCHIQQKEEPTRKILYYGPLHDNSDIFTGDSLVFFGQIKEAKVYFQKLIEGPDILPEHTLYCLSRLLVLEEDTVAQRQIYHTILANKGVITFPALLNVCSYLEGQPLSEERVNQLKDLLAGDMPPHYKAKAAGYLGGHFEMKKNQYDTSWHYFQKAGEYYRACGYITPDYQENAVRLTSIATYQRKNLRAIRQANELFDWAKYWPAADNEDKAKAYANRAFMMFRADDVKGTLEDVDEGLRLIDSVQDAEIYQELLRSRLVVYMITDDEDSWHQTIMLLEENIEQTGVDHILLDRWKGQFYHSAGDYKSAITYLKKAWEKEIADKKLHTARYSTLCYTLLDCHLHLKDFDQSLQYLYANFGRFDKYNKDSLLAIVREDAIYSFSPSAEAIQIYYKAFLHDQNKQYLLDARLFLQHVDRVMYEEMNVHEENALLQFYFESGQKYFDLGLHVNYHLFTITGDSVYLRDFLTYSERRKNSLLHRDWLQAKKQNVVPGVLIARETKLRTRIKDETRKGLRGNQQFDKLMDEYTLVENEIRAYQSGRESSDFDEGLKEITEIQKVLPSGDYAVLITDETAEAWYYTMISRDKIVIEKTNLSETLMDTVLFLVRQMAGNQDIPIHEIAGAYLSSLFPLSVLQQMKRNTFVISDGIYLRLPVHKMFDPGKYTLQNVPFLRWLTRNSQVFSGTKTQTFQNVVVFAFSDPTTIRAHHRTFLTELPGTYKEARRVEKAYKNVKIFSGKDATKANFLEAYTDPDVEYIHLALHGKANSAVKDDVKIYFRTAGGGLDSLYGYELLQYKSNCKKVVLSACQSGLGKYVIGEGNFSLPRYFLINGAAEVEWNLWDVVDL